MPTQLLRVLPLVFVIPLLLGCPKRRDDAPAASGPFAPTSITLTEVDGSDLKELVDEQLTFTDANKVVWTAPKGTLTDGASVPRLALWLTDGRFDRTFLKAAVVHDAYCQKENETRCPDQYQKKPWRDVHHMFHEACVAGGTSPSLAGMMFAGVWLGGPRWNDPDSDLQDVPEEVLRAGFEGCKTFIEENNPTPDEIESWMNDREPTVVAVSKLDRRGTATLATGDVAAAEAAEQQSDELVDEALKELPDDLMLLNLKGYHHKNWASEYRKQDMQEKADQELKKAEDTFQKTLTVKPNNPSALKGLGGVLIQKNDPERAKVHLRKVLEIEPRFPGAKRELERIERPGITRPPR